MRFEVGPAGPLPPTQDKSPRWSPSRQASAPESLLTANQLPRMSNANQARPSAYPHAGLDAPQAREEFTRWQTRAREVRSRAERVTAAIIARARRTARSAGLDPEMPFLHAHNAVISADQGTPWRSVDYTLARRVLLLERRSWAPSTTLQRWHERNPPP